MVGFFFRGQVSAVALLLAQLVCMTHAVLPAPTILSRTRSDGYKNEQLIVYFEPLDPETHTVEQYTVVLTSQGAVSNADVVIRKSTDGNNPYSPIIINGLVNGEKYSMKLFGVDSEGVGDSSDKSSDWFRSSNRAPADTWQVAPGIPTLIAKSTTTLAFNFGVIPDYVFGDDKKYSYIREEFSRGCGGAPITVVGPRTIVLESEWLNGLPTIADEMLTSGNCYKYRVLASENKGFNIHTEMDDYEDGTHSVRSVMVQTDTNSPEPLGLSYYSPAAFGNPAFYTKGFRVYEPNQNNVTLYWDSPSDGGAYIDSYLIRYINLDIGEVLTVRSPLEVTDTCLAQPTNTPCTYTVPGLLPKTRYSFQMASVNAKGAATYSTLSSSNCISPCDPENPPFSTRTLDKPNKMDAPTVSQNIADPLYMTAVQVFWVVPADNGVPITSISVSHQEVGFGDFLVVEDGSFAANATSTVVTGLSKQTSYKFLVHASNALGSSDVSVGSSVLQTLDVPDKPRDLQILTISDTFVEIKWEIPSYYVAPTTGYRVYKAIEDAQGNVGEYTAHGNVISVGNQAIVEGTSQYQSYRTNNNGGILLDELTKYHFKLAAVTAIGDSSQSNAIAATTTGRPFPPGVPEVQSMTDTTITLTWEAADNAGSPVVNHAIRIRTCDAILSCENPQEIMTGSSDTSYTITGLSKQTYYTFDLAAVNRPSTVMRTSLRTAQTDPIQTQDVPDQAAKPSASPKGHFEALIGWVKPATPGVPVSPAILDYSLEVQYKDVGTFFPTGHKIDANSTSYMFENLDHISRLPTDANLQTSALNLQPGGSYKFKIRANNKFGLAVSSAESDTVTLPTAVPQTPSDASVMQIENTSVLLEWTEGHPMGEGIFNHTISITEKQSNYSGDQGPIVVSPIRHCKGQLCDGPKVDGVTRQLLVTGLKPLSQYTFATVSINANGPSAASGSPEIRTKGPPNVMEAPTAHDLSIKHLTLKFGVPLDNGGTITQYQIIYVAQNTNDTTVHTLVKTVTDPQTDEFLITGLLPGTVYEFTISAINVYGTGPISAVSNAEQSYTLDSTGAPVMVDASPENNTQYASLGLTSLSATFDVNMGLGSGNVYIHMSPGRDGAVDTVVETIDVLAPGKISIAGPVVTFFVEESTIQEDETDYYVLVDSGAFVDKHLGPQPVFGFAGIFDRNYFHFKTWKRALVKLGPGASLTMGSGNLRFKDRAGEL